VSRRLASGGAPMRQPLVRVRDLTKTFPGVRALDAVSLEVHPGEVVALIGQNGSGKSTLVKILAGVQSADSGEVDVLTADGQTVSGPDALERLHFIHQDLGLIPNLSTIENLDLSRRLGRSALAPVRIRAERREVQDLIERFGDLFDVEAPVGSLSAAEQRIVAIARALSGWKHAENVLVLDEPTVALPGNEVSLLFEAVRRVAAEGAGIIFISHRLDEVLDLADRVVVFRDGRLVADVEASTVDHDKLVHLITGRELTSDEAGPRELAGTPVLSAQHLAGASVHDASIELSPGEIVGVGGLIGSGQEHLSGLLFGALTRTEGEVRINGEPLAPDNPHEAIKRGLAFIPADRRGRGAIMNMYARENLTLPRLAPYRRRFGRLDRKSERADAASWTRRVELSPPDPERPLNLFSGGNQQKVVIAKWLRNGPSVLLLDEPTQGVDVGAKSSIYALIATAARDGAAVLVTSSDMKELASVCDRVIVMRDGRVATTLEKAALTEANLVSASLGMRQTEVAALFGELTDDKPSPSTQSTEAEVENA
jgi:ABC-type sugar transport system ATPase subunit